MGEDDYGDHGYVGLKELKAENQRLVDLMNEALDACEDAGRPEGELLARSVKALAAERDEARSALLREGIERDEHGNLWPWILQANAEEEDDE